MEAERDPTNEFMREAIGEAFKRLAAGEATLTDEGEVHWTPESRRVGVDALCGVAICGGRYVPVFEFGG